MTGESGGLRRGYGAAHACIIVLLVAVGVRAASLVGLPLVITNDGTEYLVWGQKLLAGDRAQLVMRPDRTPGYPLLLAGTFHAFGVGPMGVLIVQHALGCATAVLVTTAALRLSGPKRATVAGILAAIDPWALALECFALSETLTVACAAGVVVLALVARPGGGWWRRWPWGIALGGLLGLSVLTRPAMQVLIPFAAAGWVASYSRDQGRVTGGLRRTVGGLVVVAAGLAAVLSPWVIVHHRQHGAYRIAGGTGAHLWSGLARVGLLSPTYPLPEPVRAAFAPLAGRALSDGEYWGFLKQVDGLGANEPLLRGWAFASIRERPIEYARMAAYALVWQLNWYPASGPIRYSEADWCLSRVAEERDNVAFEGAPSAELRPFIMNAPGGDPGSLAGEFGRWWRRLVRGWAAHQHQGIPQLPLFLAAVGLIAAACWRRDWPTALIFGGTVVYVLLHAAMLFPNSRYALPMWVIWYAALVSLPGMLRRRGGTVPVTPADGAVIAA